MRVRQTTAASNDVDISHFKAGYDKIRLVALAWFGLTNGHGRVRSVASNPKYSCVAVVIKPTVCAFHWSINTRKLYSPWRTLLLPTVWELLSQWHLKVKRFRVTKQPMRHLTRESV